MKSSGARKAMQDQAAQTYSIENRTKQKIVEGTIVNECYDDEGKRN